MDVEEAGLFEVPIRDSRMKKSLVRARQIRSVAIEAVFPAVVVLASDTHIHLSNYLAAWEFDPDPGLRHTLQVGAAYVFRATWNSERYELDGGERVLSMEQIFDPDTGRYHFHELSKVSYDGLRHRWNAHDGELQVLCRTPAEAAGEMMCSLEKERRRLVKKSGSRAGVYRLPKGAYDWSER